MRVTIRDIARKANVSASTVSRVLNNDRYVGEATRDAVRQAVQELNYSLEYLRKSPRQRPLFSVVLLTRTNIRDRHVSTVGNIDTIAASAALEAFATCEDAANIQIISRSFDEARTLLHDTEKMGFLLVGGIIERDFAAQLVACGAPFVVVGAHLRPLPVNCVMADMMKGTLEAVNHLVNKGRRRIGLVNGPPTTTTSEEKHLGLRLAATLNNIPLESSQIVTADDSFTSNEGYILTLQLLKQFPSLDSIIYAHDLMAIGGMKALREQGFRVPEDVSVIGFHDFDLAQYTDPPLTTVGFDMHLMGYIAAQRLLALWRSPANRYVTTTLIDAHLHVRGSA